MQYSATLNELKQLKEMYLESSALQFVLRGFQGAGTKVPFFLGVTVDGYQSLVKAAAFILKMKTRSILKWKQNVSPKCLYLFTTLYSVLSQNGIFRLKKLFESNVSLQDLPRCYDTQQYQKKSTGHGVAHLVET
jgi:hypothetical protein